jgi:hypothetical protein
VRQLRLGQGQLQHAARVSAARLRGEGAADNTTVFILGDESEG